MPCHVSHGSQAVGSCLGTGPLMSFRWCHISCMTSCRLFLWYGMSCRLISCYASFVLNLFSCHIMLSCHVSTCQARSPYVVSPVVSSALATRRKLHLSLTGLRSAFGCVGWSHGITRRQVEEELDSLLAEDCPFCGQIMIDAVLKPFVDLSDSKEIARHRSCSILIGWYRRHIAMSW